MKPIQQAIAIALAVLFLLAAASWLLAKHPASCQVMKPSARGTWSVGSGGLISPELVATNHHVCGSSGQVKVCWPNGFSVVGHVIGADARADVAIVKLTKRISNVKPFEVFNGHPRRGAIGFQDGAPHGKRWYTRKVKILSSDLHGVGWYPHSISGDSGGPLYGPSGTLYALCMGTNGYDTSGPSGYQVCQVLRRLFPGCIRGGRFRPP